MFYRGRLVLGILFGSKYNVIWFKRDNKLIKQYIYHRVEGGCQKSPL